MLETVKYSNADKLFFTADTHFGHANIIKYCNRPFSSVEEMDETLIRNWNSVVPADAVVFHLGDFCLDTKERWEDIFKRLNGKEKILITGNHDEHKIANGFDPGFTLVTEQMLIEIDGQPVLLKHVPLSDLDSNVWQLFGHIHSGPRSSEVKDPSKLQPILPNQYDVGVDNNDYRPVSFQEVKKLMIERTI